MSGAELLLELRSEEIPERMLLPGLKQLSSRLFEDLMGRGLGPEEMETGMTPRRLVVLFRGVPSEEPDREEEQVGPPVSVAFDKDGKPTRAAEGFAKRMGVAVEDLRRVDTDKGSYLAATRRQEGLATTAVLQELVPRLVKELSWAKTMRWGRGQGPWVRPLHGLLLLFDGELVPMELFGVESQAQTVGHPILSPEPVAVSSIADYKQVMEKTGLEIRFESRLEIIRDHMAELAAKKGGRPVDDSGLLSKLAAMVEIPGVILGEFTPDFLKLPAEVLATSLRDHQSAFAVEGGDGDLLPFFLTVMDRPDDAKGKVRAGNEWVVEARLSDARFFYEEDRKSALATRVEALDHLSFHPRLGSYAEKTARLQKLAVIICRALGWHDEVDRAQEAARLLKADLLTEMVGEFSSLQGVMGGIYLQEEGCSEEVWQAVYDQYHPASPEDSLPRGRVGLATALADRLDTLTGMFGLGLMPTGSKDPFGLRRAAQGLIRILLESKLSLDLEMATAQALELYDGAELRELQELWPDLKSFFHDRVRFLLGQKGLAYDEIEAALGAEARLMPQVEARARALHKKRQEAQFLEVVLAAKRIANIVKDGDPSVDLDESLLTESAEKELFSALQDLEEGVDRDMAQSNFGSCLDHITNISQTLDRFFVEVLVMDKDAAIRQNRMALLRAIEAVFARVAWLTEIVVDKTEYRSQESSGT
jgi:glycyl-tRNA synthetase beta chain